MNAVNAVDTVDVVVVGGGMAGMTIAAELAPTHSVAVVEQEDQLGQHATGRSAAAFLESYGSPTVRALTRASRPLFEAADLLTPRPLVWVAAADQEATLEALFAAQPNLQRLTPAEAGSLCPVLRADRLVAAAVEPDACDIDVDGTLQHYVRQARHHGVTVLRGACLSAATPDPNGSWHLALSTGADLVARVVVNAAGAWADHVAGLFGARTCGLRPLRRSIAIGRTAQPVDRAWPLVVDADERFYFRPEGPHVLLSPADETPSEPCDARPEEVDVAVAIERINQATTLEIRNVVTAWAGLRTFAPDRNPVVGFDPDVPGLFWLAGQGGYGIQMAPALAREAAALVRGETGSAPMARLSPSRFRPRDGDSD